MEKEGYIFTSGLPHPDAFISGMHDPDIIGDILNLFDLPQKEEYFLIVHHDFRGKQGLHGFQLFQRILKIEAVPTLDS